MWPQANRAETVMKGLKATIQKAEIQESDYREQLNTYLHLSLQLVIVQQNCYSTEELSIQNYPVLEIITIKNCYTREKYMKRIKKQRKIINFTMIKDIT